MGQSDQGVEYSRGRYLAIPRVLCFITQGDAVLLLKGGPHKRLWAGRFNGVGGHLEPGEDMQAALIREIAEETGMAVRDVRLRGVVHVDVGDPLQGVIFLVFTAIAETREVGRSPDGELHWFSRDALPYAEMVEDLPVLLPRLLAMGPGDSPFFALYRYDDYGRLITDFAAPV